MLFLGSLHFTSLHHWRQIPSFLPPGKSTNDSFPYLPSLVLISVDVTSRIFLLTVPIYCLRYLGSSTWLTAWKGLITATGVLIPGALLRSARATSSNKVGASSIGRGGRGRWALAEIYSTGSGGEGIDWDEGSVVEWGLVLSTWRCWKNGFNVTEVLLVGHSGNSYHWHCIYSTRTKGFVRCPFYTKSAHLHHPLSLRNVYENQRKFVLALANL